MAIKSLVFRIVNWLFAIVIPMRRSPKFQAKINHDPEVPMKSFKEAYGHIVISTLKTYFSHDAVWTRPLDKKQGLAYHVMLPSMG